MRKILAASTMVLLVTASSLGYAQQQPATAAHDGWRPSAADWDALTDARIAALKTGLQLTPEQAKNWPPVEEAIRDMARAWQARMALRHNDQQRGDAIDRLRRRADAMIDRANQLRKLADAAQPLYTSLNDDQKHRLHLLVRMMRPHHAHFAAGWDHRHEGGQQP
jgi:hypothetical protein